MTPEIEELVDTLIGAMGIAALTNRPHDVVDFQKAINALKAQDAENERVERILTQRKRMPDLKETWVECPTCRGVGGFGFQDEQASEECKRCEGSGALRLDKIATKAR